jgi:hypothetical protein
MFAKSRSWQMPLVVQRAVKEKMERNRRELEREEDMIRDKERKANLRNELYYDEDRNND